MRFSGIDDEPRIYVNGHEIGYNCGWYRPFQIDISDYVEYGKENMMAILVKRRKPEKLGYDGGVTYNFIKDWAIVKYPVKNRFLGGIFGEKNEVAIVKHLGSVIFEPRVHPKFEGLLRVTFHYKKNSEEFPLSFVEDSEFIYKPPYMHYRRLYAGEKTRADLKAIVKRALKPSTEVIIPKSLISQIISAAVKRPDLGYTNLAEFIRDAVENFINKHGEKTPR
ncbi:hypothetical protein KEJ34_09535 [Candidatus Bathyarchaeota archaeon]|nr:hypothetical protein [Candidatus Bathyarchaeota archaeon]